MYLLPAFLKDALTWVTLGSEGDGLDKSNVTVMPCFSKAVKDVGALLAAASTAVPGGIGVLPKPGIKEGLSADGVAAENGAGEKGSSEVAACLTFK